MSLKRIIDRKLIMLVVSPLLRRLGTLLVGYLAAKGVPADMLDQFMAAIAVILGLSLDIGLAALNRRKTEQTAVQRLLDNQEIDRLSSEAGINPLYPPGPVISPFYGRAYWKAP